MEDSINWIMCMGDWQQLKMLTVYNVAKVKRLPIRPIHINHRLSLQKTYSLMINLASSFE